MVRHLVAHCSNCGSQWVVRGPADKQGCRFCRAPREALTFEDETNPQDK